MITIGIDIGSVAAKGYLLNHDHHYRALIPTGWSPRDAGQTIIERLLAASGLDSGQVERIYVTGYGRVAFDHADKTVTEIKCHARGIAELFPEVRTIIDIGGQDSKVIRIEERGRVVDFAIVTG